MIDQQTRNLSSLPDANDPTAGPHGSASAHSAELLPATAAGRYAFLDELARGGMGVVYRATDTVLGREVAVKLLSERFGPDSAAARRFVDEARIAGQLQHPGIPAVHDLGTLADGRPFLAMKLVKGSTLEALLKSRVASAAERGRFVAVFEQICQAVGYAHAHQVIHRDLKPSNVMVGSFGEVQVMDWGLAKVLASRERERPELDDGETAAGTKIQSTRDSDGAGPRAAGGEDGRGAGGSGRCRPGPVSGRRPRRRTGRRYCRNSGAGGPAGRAGATAGVRRVPGRKRCGRA